MRIAMDPRCPVGIRMGAVSFPMRRERRSCRAFVQNYIVARQMAPRVEGRSLPPVLGVTSR